ncbi:ly-6/neurotoxin-like protein 1 [Hyalella azteca]|uniref:Ly-6/neurotoxin-like protein 1 n=1 Tax=Hyalella azteca TaxID=294128 RepID=A0A8B7N568_HYAAZ|nr:ly-6/neurotoxin-like protein 1 [Hyalella azteca]XP_018008750.1 ly-6/neurotoxin-like protein 1 [Hyalella azteca]XP_018008751.1 ly-6/neurotoxin-like protein 1 [Hyalella azteca]XP_047741586.1 ly-6/neurotoxin-like protein 1 [Hyalella azteca]XP_047741587.1 ly-6/neurotoxin-like protein 1 [Hyalella azteca]
MARMWLSTCLVLLGMYSVAALECYTCADCKQNPAVLAPCPSSLLTHCSHMEVNGFIAKSCVPKLSCTLPGVNINCCDTDGCNGAGLPAPAALLLLTVPLIASFFLR